jgi:hypothetical protein
MRKEIADVNLNGSFRKSDADITVKPFNLHTRYESDILSAQLLLSLLLILPHVLCATKIITLMLLPWYYTPFCKWDRPVHSSSVKSYWSSPAQSYLVSGPSEPITLIPSGHLLALK